MRGVLDVLDEIAPGSHLGPYVHQLCKDSQQETRVVQQIAEAAVTFSLSKRLTSHLRKPREGDKNGPEDRNRTKDHVGRNDPHGLTAQVSGVDMLPLHGRDLAVIQFDSREDVDGTDQGAGD